MIMLKKLISVILGLAMVFSMSIGVSAEISESFEEKVDNDSTVLADEHSITVENNHDVSGEDLGFIPDFFAENDIDTNNHIAIPFTRTTSQLNTMITNTYPSGSYFTKSGNECTSHSGCNYSSSSAFCVNGCGNCTAYQSAIQCHAFVKYAYYIRNGKQITTGQTSTASPITTAIISSNFLAGTMVRLKPLGGDFHSVLVVANDTTAKKVSIYHANYGGKCKVAYQTVSYADFISAFPSYYYYSKA